MRISLGQAPSPTPARSTVGERLVVLWLVALVATAWVWTIQDPARVRLTIVNRSSCPVWVAIGPADADRVLDVGPVAGQATLADQPVLDMGSRWRVRTSRAGHLLSDQTVGRSELQRTGWRVELPAIDPDGAAASSAAASSCV